MTNGNKRQIRGIIVGLLFLCLLHMLAWLLVIAVGTVLFSGHSFLAFYIRVLFSFWLWQLCYATPAIIWSAKQGYRETTKGICIGIIISVIIHISIGVSNG